MSITIADLAVFGETPSEEFTIRPDADRILAGSPDQTAWNYFTDRTGQFSAGIWEGAPGVWRVNFTENHGKRDLPPDQRRRSGPRRGRRRKNLPRWQQLRHARRVHRHVGGGGKGAEAICDVRGGPS
jgi:hypothetical protein